MARTRPVEAIPPSPLPAYNSMVASAKPIMPQKSFSPKYLTWQSQAWDYYDTIGEFEYGVSWLSNLLSRVRLVAAEVREDAEPELLELGPAVDYVARLAGGVGGQSQLMKEFTVHLSVPGECWLVGEPPDEAVIDAGGPDEETWTVYSADELRVARRKIRGELTYEVREGEADQYRLISPDSLVVRCWNPHPRYGWRADSPARHALGALFELDVTNKRIIATILSRLANNGILLYDKTRLSIPGQGPGPNDPEKPDPFAQVLVTVAGRGIADPASPEACIPIPIGFELGELTDVDPKMLMQLIKFSEGVDETILSQRESAIKRLATSLDLPAEVLLGMGDLNHWGAAQIEESAIKIHATPVAELIAYSLTVGYLHPMMKAAGDSLVGPNGGRIVIWYDPSEITARSDKSANSIQAYDRGEINGEALRREIGLEEDDAPDETQLLHQTLVKLAQGGNMDALGALGYQPEEDGKALPTEIQMTIDLAIAAPSLAQAPGLPALKKQIEELLGLIPEGSAPAPAAPEAPAVPPSDSEPDPATKTPDEPVGPEEGEEGPAAPDTRGDDAPSKNGRPPAPVRTRSKTRARV